MSWLSPTWTMFGLNVLMIVYTLWVLSLNRTNVYSRIVIGLVMLIWLAVLHLGLSNQSLFARDISGVVFLLVIFSAVAVIGLVLFLIPPLKRLVMALNQSQLLLFQGIRVFFGAIFLVQAATGTLPQTFGILDGLTHIAAGFLGLVAAFSLAADIQGTRRAWFANLFGVIDILIVAGTLALLLLPDIGPHHSMMYAVFLPAPLWLWFHIISIWKLLGWQNQRF